MTPQQVEEAAVALETLAARFRALNAPHRPGRSRPYPHDTGMAVHPARVAVDLIETQMQDEWAALILAAGASQSGS